MINWRQKLQRLAGILAGRRFVFRLRDIERAFEEDVEAWDL